MADSQPVSPWDRLVTSCTRALEATGTATPPNPLKPDICPLRHDCDWWPVESIDEHLHRAHSKVELVEAVSDLLDVARAVHAARTAPTR
jgi:hypothetical protein